PQTHPQHIAPPSSLPFWPPYGDPAPRVTASAFWCTARSLLHLPHHSRLSTLPRCRYGVHGLRLPQLHHRRLFLPLIPRRLHQFTITSCVTSSSCLHPSIFTSASSSLVRLTPASPVGCV
ncbi:hypothetical protein CC78DRAFT_511637, partial [Lojkania enalia]